MSMSPALEAGTFEFVFLVSLLFEKSQHLVSMRAVLIFLLFIVATPTHSRTHPQVQREDPSPP